MTKYRVIESYSRGEMATPVKKYYVQWERVTSNLFGGTKSDWVTQWRSGVPEDYFSQSNSFATQEEAIAYCKNLEQELPEDRVIYPL